MKGRLSARSLARVVTAGALALMLFAGLSLLFSRLHVWARSAPESTIADAVAAPSVLTPTSQTRSPAKGALITEKGALPIEGVAWLGDNRPPFPGDPTLSPIVNNGEPNYVVDWTEPALGEFYVLYEADNAYFEDQTELYSGPDSQTFISNQPKGTYYYRVKSYNADGASRWSNVESVTVGPAASSMASELPEVAAGEQITVWVRVDAGAWQTATLTETDWGGWTWSYDWSLPEDESYQEHAIHTKASSEGSSGPTDTITVTVNNRMYSLYLPRVYKRWPPIPLAPMLQSINNPDHRASYTVRWSYEGREGIPDPESYTVQEDTNGAFSSPTVYTVPSGLSKAFTKGTEGTYYYRVRGNNSYGPGEWSNIVSTVVRLRPYAPTLQNIDNADGDNSYTVDWSYAYTYPSVTTFILQEATDPAFSDAVAFTTGADRTSYSFSGKGNRTYYYRVKGRNTYGDGPWSVVKSVRSFSADFYDTFSDPGSGWKTHDARCCLSGCDNGGLQEHPKYKYSLFYADGRYHVKIPLDCRAGGEHGDTRHIYPVTFAPDVERPQSRTCVEVKGTFEAYETYWSFWGLVFAASDDKSTVWSLEVNDLGDWAVVKRTGYDFPGPNAPFENENRSYEVDYLGRTRWPARAGFDPNTLRAEVDGNNVKLYINGTKVHEFSEAGIRSLRKVGIMGGAWEITPTQIGYSYFYLDKGCDDY